jgi:putative ABC transport system permease protein
MLIRIKRALRNLLRRTKVESELDEELRYHIEQQAEQNIRLGMDPEAARSAALRAFGGVEQAKERCREARGVRWLEDIWQDLRYGVRMLLKKPGFTLTAVITFALGIGVNTVVFSCVYLLLFQPLPYPDAERLAVISQTSRQGVESGVSYPDFTAWKEQNPAFERMAAYHTSSVNLTSGDPVKRVTGSYVSAEFFPMLDGRPRIGRPFLAEEFRPGGDRVVILSHSFWHDRFGADEGVLGRTLKFDGQSHTIVGVMPSSFSYPFRAAFWTPLEASEQAKTLQDAAANNYEVIGLLRQGVSVERAAEDLAALARGASLEKSAGQPELTLKVARLRDTIPGLTKYRAPIMALQFAVPFVLLIASVNLSNLLLARNAVRHQEFTIRLAIGASRWRLVRQLLVESLLLGLLGSLLGILLAMWGMDLVRAFGDLRLPGVGDIEINMPVLLITLLVSLLTSLAFGLGPALMAGRQDLIESLKTGVTTSDPRQRRLSGILIVAEVALAVALLAGSGLMIRTFLNLTKEDPGFEPGKAIAVSLALPSSQRADYESLASYFDEAVMRVRALPGVESVGGVTYLPLVGYNPGVNFTIDGRESSPETTPRADVQPITPDYFRAIGIPLRRGRQFTEADMNPQPDAAIINHAFAKKFWPDEDPLGKHILLQGDNLPRSPLAVVGIVGDVKQFGLHTEPRPEIYLPMRRHSMTLIVRTGGDPARLFPALRETLEGLDNQAAISMKTMEQVVSRSTWTPRNLALQLGILGAVSLLLAAMGIYGVISYVVAQRTREMGIRVALGARRRDILRLILGRGLTLTLLGVAAGLALSFALSLFLSSMLFGVSAGDPTTFVAITLLLAGVALTASYLPARRATKVNPLVALRYE